MRPLFLYILPGVMAMALTAQPAVVGLTILVNSIFTMLKSWLFRQAAFRKAFNMAPQVPQPAQPSGKGFINTVMEEAERRRVEAERRKAAGRAAYEQKVHKNSRIAEVMSAKAYEKKLAAARMKKQQRERTVGLKEDKY
jgi:hypothetical protein